MRGAEVHGPRARCHRLRPRCNLVWYYQSLAAAFSSKANTIGDRGLKRLSTELDRTIKLIESYSP